MKAINVHTPHVYMDDLELLGAALEADGVSSGLSRIFLYPLCFAASNGGADIVRFVLETGYDKDFLNADGDTPLRSAAKAGRL